MDIETFIHRWRDREGGAERANATMYLLEMTQALDLPPPDPAGADTAHNDYVFERAVRSPFLDTGAPSRIDLYKRGCFVLEAKQSRWTRDKADAFAADEIAADIAAWRAPPGRRWDALMRNARAQAHAYVGLLPADHPAPPFVIVCDVARHFEIWADFSGTGRGYAPFPDRNGFRVTHESLSDPAIQSRLRTIWTAPHSLDPTREAAIVTREIVDDLSHVSRRLERQGHAPEDVAHFLMRCIFTIFAADVGLLPKAPLLAMLEDCVATPAAFPAMMQGLWICLDDPAPDRRFFSGFGERLPHINGGLFADPRALPLEAEDLSRLAAAARRDWRQVEPAIFGSLLEHALDPDDRRRLGAHYTPRAFVEPVIQQTVIEPLSDDWRGVLIRAEAERDAGDHRAAVATVRAFHRRLCTTRVLDPACGTGNFLYVALEMMKRLEGVVLDTLAEMGEPERLGLDTIEPGQFLGLELNPRAAAIAELVLWIGFLQQHYRSHTGHPSEPILRAHGNIQRLDAVLDEAGRRPDWPEAEFIVGNPPFIGGKDLRSRLGDDHAERLWRAHPAMNPSADLVMYWWDHAADILTSPGSVLRRFGLVTTNSITQPFQRRSLERWLGGDRPISLVHAVADHPWTRASRDSAAVRIAVTVAEAGRHDGRLADLVAESALDTDTPDLTFSIRTGRINPDLTIGTDASTARPLKANGGLCCPGVKLHGAGFLITPDQAPALGAGTRPGLDRHLRPYLNGRDLTGRPRGLLVLDVHDVDRHDLMTLYPEAYQHLVETVKEVRDADGRPVGRDVNPRETYRRRWWAFGEPRSDFRPALAGLGRYIATVETAKHRVFRFLDAGVLADNMLVCVADDDAATLAVLSSHVHLAWTAARGGALEDRPRYTKTACFDPFPFPTLDEATRERVRAAGEALEAHRTQVLGAHPGLTLTALYNVLEAVRAGLPLAARDEAVKRDGLVLILRDLHAEVDGAVQQAYGWLDDPEPAEIVARLVSLNLERADEESAGLIRHLRPDFQTVQIAARSTTTALRLPFSVIARQPARAPLPRLGRDEPLAIQAALVRAGAPLATRDLVGRFKGRRREARIERALSSLYRYGHVHRLPDGRWVAARAR